MIGHTGLNLLRLEEELLKRQKTSHFLANGPITSKLIKMEHHTYFLSILKKYMVVMAAFYKKPVGTCCEFKKKAYQIKPFGGI